MAGYICTKAIGDFKYGDVLEEKNGNLVDSHGCFVCRATSYRAHKHFVYDGDNQGKKREELISKIFSRLSPPDYGETPMHADSLSPEELAEKDRQAKVSKEAWEKIWADEKCRVFKKLDIPEDHWLWGHSFYVAPTEDLQYIADLICT